MKNSDTLRLYNAKILTMESTDILTGELWIQGDQIVHVGEVTTPPPLFDQEYDLKGNLVLPGFINAHGHAPMVFLRSFADDLPLQQWLEQQVFPMEERLSEEQAYELTKLAILEYLSSGIVTSFEMYLYPYAMAKAAVEMGFPMILCGAVNDFTHSVQELEEQYHALNHFHPQIQMRLGFHGEYTTAPDILSDLAALAHQEKAPVYTHLSETQSEVDDCLSRHGKTPPQYLWDKGLWRHGGGGFHCVHMSADDHKLFAQKGLATITCPGSNAKLASGVPDLLVREQGLVAIGTDGAASNNALDFFREMYLTTVLQKLRTGNAAALPPQQVLSWATRTGAKALQLDQQGVLAPGAKARLVVIDLDQPNMQPQNNLLKNLVYSGSKQNVWMTLVDGKVLYHKGRYFLKQSPQEIYEKCNKIVRDVSSA